MTKLKLSLIGATVIGAVAVSLVIQSQSNVKLHEKEDALREQDSHLAELGAEHQRLSNLVAQAKGSYVDSQMADLVRLRNEAEALKEQTNALGKQLTQIPRAWPSQAVSKPTPHPPEYYQELHQMAGGKDKDAIILALALGNYAHDHKRRFPSDLDQVAPYLLKEGMSLTGTNQFEIVYQGSLDELKNIPMVSVALIRDRQIWRAPSGKIARVYGMVGGIAQIVESDDNFQAWEAEHIIPPPAAK
jgi:hypothetical protein